MSMELLLLRRHFLLIESKYWQTINGTGPSKLNTIKLSVHCLKIVEMHIKHIKKLILLCLSTGIALQCSFTSAMAQQTNVAQVSVESSVTAKQLSDRSKSKAEIMDYRGAIADISKAIQLNPNEADYYYQRGLILGKLSDRESAVSDFDDAILRDPNHAWAYLQRAGMSFNLGFGLQIRDYRGFNYNYFLVDDGRRGDARAMLDLRTARDLFERQNNQEGLQIAERLIQHFGNSLPEESN